MEWRRLARESKDGRGLCQMRSPPFFIDHLDVKLGMATEQEKDEDSANL